MPNWLATCIVVVVFSLIMVPLQKWISRKINNSVAAYIVTIIIATGLLLGLYSLTSLAGLGPYTYK